MNTDDISFADFLVFNAPPVSKAADQWLLHAYAFVPLGVEAALERLAKAHERTRKPSTLLLSGASVVQQRAAVRWLSERLDLPAFIVNAAEFSNLPEAFLDDVLAPLGEGIPRLFVIRNVDALPPAAAARLMQRRPHSVVVFATSAAGGSCDEALRARFRATIDWRAQGPRHLTAMLAARLSECFARFGGR